MRVLIVTQYFHPEPFRINDLALALHDSAHQVTVLTGMPNYPEGRLYRGYRWFSPASENYFGIQVVRVPLITRGGVKSWRLMLNYISFAISASIFGLLRCRQQYDVVLVYEPSPITVGLPGMLLGELKNAPVMLWIQDLWPETLAAVGQHGFLSRIAGRVANFVHRGCDRLLVQSEAFIQPLISRGIAAARIRYLPNWAEDLYLQKNPDLISDQHHQTNGTRFLFAGNLGGAQSLETILDAAEALRNRPDIQWIIVGDGVMRAWLTEQIHSRRLDVTMTLLGRRPVEDMPALFSAADALLVTLRRDPAFSMTIPSKIQSYLASGMAIVGAIDGEGARIISESGAGLVAKAGDYQGLARCVQEMTDLGPARRNIMGRRGREYFDKHFNRDHLIQQLEVWMHEAVEEKNADAYPRR